MNLASQRPPAANATMRLLHALLPVLIRLPGVALFRRVRHGVTMGVRAIAIDGENRVLLVRHTYTPGWHLPGGGVDVGETAEEAARREMHEEANVATLGPLLLHGLYRNAHGAGRDHVVCYRVPRFKAGPPPRPSLEIAEVGWFALDALPADTTPATVRRLNEITTDTPPSALW